MVDTIRCLEEAIGRFVIDDDDDACPDEEFALSEVSDEERGTVIGGNEYLRGVMKSSGLEILKKNLVLREYEERKEQGLFHLFLNQSFLEGVRV